MSDSRDVVFEAYAVSDYGDGPAWARLAVDAAFLRRLEHLAALLQAHRLTAVATYDAPDAWDMEGELRLRSAELVVSGDAFWFEARPKHADYYVETRAVPVREFIATVSEALRASEASEPLVFGSDPAGLKALLAEASENEEAAHG
jgi:hypothetical protein